MNELLVIAGYVVCIGVLVWQRYLLINANKQITGFTNLMKAAVVVGKLTDQILVERKKEIDALKKELSDLKEAVRKI